MQLARMTGLLGFAPSRSTPNARAPSRELVPATRTHWERELWLRAAEQLEALLRVLLASLSSPKGSRRPDIVAMTLMAINCCGHHLGRSAIWEGEERGAEIRRMIGGTVHQPLRAFLAIGSRQTCSAPAQACSDCRDYYD
jgi:hypothetical protein